MTLQQLIGRAYPAPEWSVFYEVSNATGFGSTRRADAVALGIWPSRGHKLIGFEFKEDRRDWLRELKNPAKAEAIAAHCDEWWLVIGREGVALPEELPAPWGLKVASNDRTRLMTAKPAVPFEGRNALVIQRHFAAAMLRKVTENMVLTSEVSHLVEEAVRKRAANYVAPEEHELNRLRGEVERLESRINAFEKASGVAIDTWRPGLVGAAVQIVMDMQRMRRMLEHAEANVSSAAKALKAGLNELPNLEVGR